ncbi:hypothetical protein SAMN05421686_1223 [Thalassolituus maritimus]|uniref:Uncharacterized protein n=1 Tax=Thalassolituus maritimus TaxID=484498 RepID=A0A1N7QDJ8_9GAMM|nr:hypothetical protein [Thalassolituus maritimus]SIT20647.1 hypothetical protein SAMN05421686_1223 [Thalassolituus maritimus]
MTDQNDVDQLELAISLPVIRADIPQHPETFALFPIFAPVNDRSKMDTDWQKRGQFSYSFPWGVWNGMGRDLIFMMKIL